MRKIKLKTYSRMFFISKAYVSTDEGNDSSRPAQSGNRKFKLFRINKGLMVSENLSKQFRLHDFLTTKLFEVSNNLSRINK